MTALRARSARLAARLVLSIGIAALVSACDPTGPKGPTFVTGALEGTHDWRPERGPYQVTGEGIQVDGSLTVHAGTEVHVEGGAEIRIADGGELIAMGTAERPVVFTAADSTLRWGGIVGAEPPSLTSTGHAALRHVRIEHATVGVALPSLVIEDAVIREIQGSGVIQFYSGAGRLSRTVIDRACLTAPCAAVVVASYTSLELEDVTIRNSGGHGVFVNRRAGIGVSDVRITGSASVGLVFSSAAGGDPTLTVRGPVRITGGGSYPASLPLGATISLLDAIPADSLLGNSRDSLHVWTGGGVGDRPSRIGPLLPWVMQASGGMPHIPMRGELRLDPGSTLALRSDMVFSHGGRLVAEGTADSTVAIRATSSAIHLTGSPETASTVRHARLEYIQVVSEDEHTIRLSDVTVHTGTIRLGSPGSSIQRTLIEYPAGLQPPPSGAAVRVSAEAVDIELLAIRGSPGHGLLVDAPGFRLSDCAVTGSAGDAVRMLAPATDAEIQRCDLVDSGGVGVHSEATEPVLAIGNWWGDPDGPLGLHGDGVAGTVVYEPWATAPFDHAGLPSTSTWTSASKGGVPRARQ